MTSGSELTALDPGAVLVAAMVLAIPAMAAYNRWAVPHCPACRSRVARAATRCASCGEELADVPAGTRSS